MQEYLSDDEYSQLQQALAASPEVGSVIPGSGGVRKMRWGVAGRGKRGGLRVINFLPTRHGQIWMLTLYPKNVAENIRLMFSNRSRMKSMARTVAKRNVGMEILEGLRQLKRGEMGA